MANKWLKKSFVVGLAGLSLAACGSKSTDSLQKEALLKVKKNSILYSNKSEIQDALTAYAKEWGDKNGVTVNIKTCSGSCKIADQLKTEFTLNRSRRIRN